jgi:hypothetical protein
MGSSKVGMGEPSPITWTSWDEQVATSPNKETPSINLVDEITRDQSSKVPFFYRKISNQLFPPRRTWTQCK